MVNSDYKSPILNKIKNINFERRSDTTLKEHEYKLNFKSEYSPIANQSSKPISVTQEGMAAADDLDT